MEGAFFAELLHWNRILPLYRAMWKEPLVGKKDQEQQILQRSLLNSINAKVRC